jgi:hypothetical protein
VFRKKYWKKTKAWRMSFKKEKKSGLGLIEALIVLFILVSIVLSFSVAASLGLKHIREAKLRLMATALAREKIEKLNAWDYTKIGTLSGLPAGDLLAEERVIRDAETFQVATSVNYFDDPYDGTAAGPLVDASPQDYKKVKVEVTWEENLTNKQKIVLIADFFPREI